MRHSSRIAWMLAVVILAPATGATAVEIRTVVVEPECFPGNSPGGCFLTPRNTSGPEAAFGTPPDRQLDFRFVIADGQLIRMTGVTGGYDLTFTVTPPEVTVNLDGITVQFRSGKVFTSGPLGPFPEGFQVGGCSMGFPEGVRAACDESAWPLGDEGEVLGEQVLVSFSLDAADPTQPQLAIGRLVIYAGGDAVLLVVPQPPALWLIAVALVGMIVVSYRRRAGRPVS